MCVIIHLPPNARMKKEHLVNAVHNNHHSWGLVLVDGNNRSQLIRKCPQEGKYDPEEIWDILEDNLDVHRYLHLRNTTRGATNDENTQPFQVYSSDTRQVYFFHNGTLNSFGATTGGMYVNGIWKQTVGTENNISDTRDFCEKILQPALIRWHGPDGPADYNDQYFNSLIMDKQWTTSSKGMFVSNDMPPKYYGAGWSQYKQDDPDAPIIMVSNQDYFNTVTRGPAKPASGVAGDGFFPDKQTNKEAEKTGATGSTTGNETTGKNNPLGMEVVPFMTSSLVVNPTIVKSLEGFFEGLEEGPKDNDDYSALANIACEEWYSFICAESTCNWSIAAMLEFMSSAVASEHKKRVALEGKLERAQKLIEQQQKGVKHAA